MKCARHNVEFDPLKGEGCPQCIDELWHDATDPPNDEMEDGLNSEVLTLAKPNIVKVQYYSDSRGLNSPVVYTYYSVDKLKVGDIVIVPVRDTTGKAMVSAIDVPEAEISAFKDKVKTIPAGSVGTTRKELEHIEQERVVTDYGKMAEESTWLNEPDPNAWRTGEEEVRTIELETALALRPGEDIEVHGYYDEAVRLLEYAQRRAIKTLEDAKVATDDLSIISRVKKAMEAKRKEKLAPHQAEVKAIQDTYNYLMSPVLEAERITKSKQVAFLQGQERIKREQEQINALRLEAARKDAALHNGEISESVNLVEVQEAPERIMTNMGTTGLSTIWKFEVVDFSLLPDRFKIENATLIGKVVRAGEREIPGVRIYLEQNLRTTLR